MTVSRNVSLDNRIPLDGAKSGVTSLIYQGITGRLVRSHVLY